MRAIQVFLILFLATRFGYAAPLVYEGNSGPGLGRHIVFLAGDHEYRSEETLPALARILALRHGFKCTVLFTVDRENGEIVPGNSNMPGLEALASADLAVFFLRFQAFPADQMKHIAAYLERGGPIVGLRTATHAFDKIPETSPYAKFNWNNVDQSYQHGFGHHVLGQTWIGHYGVNHRQSTRLLTPEGQASHPILRGVSDVWVQCGGYVGRPVDGVVLSMAQPLNGMSPAAAADPTMPPMPAAWTRTYRYGSDGTPGRVFTSLHGASEDILNDGYRRTLVNACYWAVGLDGKIDGKRSIEFVGPYHPTTFRNGGHRRGVKPEDLAGWSAPIMRPDRAVIHR